MWMSRHGIIIVMEVQPVKHCTLSAVLLTSWEQFCTEACIWVLWWLWGCQWSRSPRRPQRSRSRPSSSPSPRLHGWSLQQRWHSTTVTIYGQNKPPQPPWNVNKKMEKLAGLKMNTAAAMWLYDLKKYQNHHVLIFTGCRLTRTT